MAALVEAQAGRDVVAAPGARRLVGAADDQRPIIVVDAQLGVGRAAGAGLDAEDIAGPRVLAAHGLRALGRPADGWMGWYWWASDATFGCDVSGGHSGSSLYHYLDGSTLVVTGIVSWQHCTTCGPDDDRPNTGVRITQEYSGTISWLRQTFP